MPLRNLISRYISNTDHETFLAEQQVKLQAVKETINCLIEEVEKMNQQAKMDGEGRWFLKMVQGPAPTADADLADVHFDAEEETPSCLKTSGTP